MKGTRRGNETGMRAFCRFNCKLVQALFTEKQLQGDFLLPSKEIWTKRRNCKAVAVLLSYLFSVKMNNPLPYGFLVISQQGRRNNAARLAVWFCANNRKKRQKENVDIVWLANLIANNLSLSLALHSLQRGLPFTFSPLCTTTASTPSQSFISAWEQLGIGYPFPTSHTALRMCTRGSSPASRTFKGTPPFAKEISSPEEKKKGH